MRSITTGNAMLHLLIAVVAALAVCTNQSSAALPPHSLTSHPVTETSGDSVELFNVYQFGSDDSTAPIIISVPLSAVSVLPIVSAPPLSALPGLYTSPLTAATPPDVRTTPSASTPLATSPIFALGTGQTPAAFFGGAPSGGAGLPSGLSNSVIGFATPSSGEFFSPLGLVASLRGGTGAAGMFAGNGLAGLAPFATPGQAGSTLTPADIGALSQGSGLSALAAQLGSVTSPSPAPFGLVGGLIGGSQLAFAGALPSAVTTGALGIFGARTSSVSTSSMAAAALGLSSPALRGGSVSVINPATGRPMGARGVSGRRGTAGVRSGTRGTAGVTFVGPMTGRASGLASLRSIQNAAARAPRMQFGRGRGGRRGAGSVGVGAEPIGGRFGSRRSSGGVRERGGIRFGRAGPVGGRFGAGGRGRGGTRRGFGSGSRSRGRGFDGFGSGGRGGGWGGGGRGGGGRGVGFGGRGGGFGGGRGGGRGGGGRGGGGHGGGH